MVVDFACHFWWVVWLPYLKVLAGGVGLERRCSCFAKWENGKTKDFFTGSVRSPSDLNG